MKGLRAGSTLWLTCRHCHKEYDLAIVAKVNGRERKIRCTNCNRIVGELN